MPNPFPVVVIGSTSGNQYDVINFLSLSAPAILFQPTLFSGCVVDCSGPLAAVGNSGGGDALIYEISSPPAPVSQGPFPTGLSSIGALSLDGTNLLVGASNGWSIALIDVSSSSPQPTMLTLPGDYQSGISAIVLNGSTAVACGPAGFAVLNVGPNLLELAGTFHAAPITISSTGNSFTPGTCDFDGTTAAFADSSSDNIYMYTISGGNATYQIASNTGLYPPVSIAVLGNQIAVGSATSNEIWLGVNRPGAAVSAVPVPGAVGVGALKFLAGQPVLAVATNNGTNGFGATLFSTSGWPNIATQPISVASGVNVAPTTLGFTYVLIPQGCITALLNFFSNPFGR
jgi:hypothetical protein